MGALHLLLQQLYAHHSLTTPDTVPCTWNQLRTGNVGIVLLCIRVRRHDHGGTRIDDRLCIAGFVGNHNWVRAANTRARQAVHPNLPVSWQRHRDKRDGRFVVQHRVGAADHELALPRDGRQGNAKQCLLDGAGRNEGLEDGRGTIC